ncbi:hypothetical protein IU11_03205 [Cellulosimicrobium sp. MM]|nr:hypothetical protein IU11_03205 [Cellulosimicrobium sp. MM]
MASEALLDVLRVVDMTFLLRRAAGPPLVRPGPRSAGADVPTLAARAPASRRPEGGGRADRRRASTLLPDGDPRPWSVVGRAPAA